MARTLRSMLGTARRALGDVAPRRHIPTPPVTVGPGGVDVVAPEGPHIRYDPALDVFAEMVIAIGSNFTTGSPLLLPNIYDRERHEYRANYLSANRITLQMTPKPGLERHLSTLLPGNPRPLVRTRTAGEGNGFADLEQEFARASSPPLGLMLRLDSDDGAPGGSPQDRLPVEPSPPLGPPDFIVAYDWVISRTSDGGSGRSWGRHLIVQNPTAFDLVQGIGLDGVGNYSVRLRVVATGHRFAEKTVTFSVQEKFIVGLGESYAAGQGNPDGHADVSNANPFGGPVCDMTTLGVALDATPATEDDPVWLEPKAHRSFCSGHAFAALSLMDRYGETWNKETGPGPSKFSFTKVTFASFARSGARIYAGLLAPQDGEGDYVGAGQVEESRRAVNGRPIDALLISIGGNDAGFAGVLRDLVSEDSLYTATLGHGGKSPAEVKARLDELLGVGLDEDAQGVIETDLRTLGAVLNQHSADDMPIRDIYINTYPTDLFFVERSGGGVEFRACDIFKTQLGVLTITRSEALAIKAAATRLNEILVTVAGDFGWHIVNITPDFDGHGYCRRDNEQMWIDAETSCRTQADFDGTMHPNRRGHTLTALRYHEQLIKYTMKQDTADAR
ncbi:hypothetical protein [Streptomyces sp. NPDC102476]|uniref:hypothetical protein n=1 Tax=Streptomyces sp. NPDC102476 TaxID=3366181 RepID=UPI00382E461D